MPELEVQKYTTTRQKIISHKWQIIAIIFILIAIPITIVIALNRQNFQKFADGGLNLGRVDVNPGEVIVEMDITNSIEMSALAYDFYDYPMSDYEVLYEWSMSSVDSVGTLSESSGIINTFIPLKVGFGEITVIASFGEATATKTIPVHVIEEVSLTPTPIPEPVTISFQTIKLHGIGSGGDNTNPDLPGNLNPLNRTRDMSIELNNSDGSSFFTSGIIQYSSSSGYFSGEASFSEDIPVGDYLVKVKSPQYLKEQLDGIISIGVNEVNQMPSVVLVAGDVDNNNVINIDDYTIIIDCYSDLLPAKNCDAEGKKESADISDDGEVNADDYNLFLREISVARGD